MNKVPSVSGRAIKAARILAGMTQTDLAAAAGLHPKSVSYWERKGGRGAFGEVGLRRIIEALEATGIAIENASTSSVRIVQYEWACDLK